MTVKSHRNKALFMTVAEIRRILWPKLGGGAAPIITQRFTNPKIAIFSQLKKMKISESSQKVHIGLYLEFYTP